MKAINRFLLRVFLLRPRRPFAVTESLSKGGYRVLVPVVLVTGMSGTGKSTALRPLAPRGESLDAAQNREAIFWFRFAP